jgi:hypothetical protein
LFSNHYRFDVFIIICIILNTIVFTVKWFGQPKEVGEVTDIINYVFAAIFSIEALIKIIANGRYYFTVYWNIFDFSIVIGTLGGLILTLVFGVSIGPITTLVRSFRVFRIFRLVKQAKSLKLTFNTFLVTLPALVNVGSLLLLFLFLFSILGNNLFAKIKIAPPLNNRVNFQNFGFAFITLFRISTGEAWNEIMAATTRTYEINFQC